MKAMGGVGVSFHIWYSRPQGSMSAGKVECEAACEAV